MNKISLICHSALVLVTFLAMNSFAAVAGPTCSGFFANENLTIRDLQSKDFKKETFLNTESTMSALKTVLSQIRTANPSRDHIEFFSAQVPLIMDKLMIKHVETSAVLAKPEMVAMVTRRQADLGAAKVKKMLAENMEKSYQGLLSEATERVRTRTVTYEWYMSFFLKSMIFSDVSARILDAGNSKEKYEVLNRKIDTLTGKSKVFFSDDVREMVVYASLGKEFSTLTRDAYFTRYLPEHTMVPVLFVPRNSDMIEAEQMGLHFVSLVGSRKDTAEGKKFPLKFAGLQMEQNLKQVHSFRSFENPKTKWIKFHNKISNVIKGDAALEALYVYLIRDAGLQSELTQRFETGYRISFFSFDAHKPSEFLKAHFVANKNYISTIASQVSVDALLKVIVKIEQEGLASGYKN